MKEKSMDIDTGRGKVWLVGAGPGDSGLMTIKGREVLSKADVVVYDALIGGSILSMMPGSAEKIYVGKRSGLHTLEQSGINRILLEKAEQGKRVVRLKGGDPFIFGRGGEELKLLAEAGIPFEVVPGVTSAAAVPAYAGIPVTHRDFCSSLHIVTGHRRKADNGGSSDRPDALGIDFAALAEAGGTIVFLMGISSLPVLMNGLLCGGMDPDTPAAVIERGTTASQRIIRSTVSCLGEEAARQGAGMPAVIVVGEVVSLSEDYSWLESLPLGGVRAVVTRPRELTSSLSGMLREKGAEVIELPAISIEPITDNEALDRALRGLRGSSYEWVVFTSPSGVRVFMDRLMQKYDIRILSYSRIAAIGRGTERELIKYGIRPDMIPSVYEGLTLGRELASMLREGDRVLIPRAAIGGQELTEELSKVRGVVIDDIPTYDTVYASHEWFDADAAFRDPHTYALFTSASTVRGFAHSYPETDFGMVRAVCIGRQTASEAERYGMVTYTSEEAALESLCAKLESIVNEELK